MTDARPLPWLYFGCRQRGSLGHYLHAEGMRSPDMPFDARRAFERKDGSLCYEPALGLYVAKVSRLRDLGCSALAFWDQTVDTRGGSNSIFFAPGLEMARHPLPFIEIARYRFPQVFARLPDIDLTRALADA